MGRMALCFLIAIFGLKVASADDEQSGSAGDKLVSRCLLLVRAESSFPPRSSQALLEAHQSRARVMCWDWRAVAASAEPDRKTKASQLLERCLSEASFDLARSHEQYYVTHVQLTKQMCRDCAALVLQ